MVVLKGIQKEVVQVEVTSRQLYESTIEEIEKKHPELRKLAYINNKGERMIVSGVNYHHNEEEYSSDGPATEKEIMYEKLKDDLWELLK